jgi:hypothetical protein
MSASYKARARGVRQSAIQPRVAKSGEENLRILLTDVPYAARWQPYQPKPRDRSLEAPGVLVGFPPRWRAEGEKLGESGRGEETQHRPSSVVNDDALTPAVNDQPNGLIHMLPVWQFATFPGRSKRASQLNEKAIKPGFRPVRVWNHPALKTCRPICWRRPPARSGSSNEYSLVLFPQTSNEEKQASYLHGGPAGLGLA